MSVILGILQGAILLRVPIFFWKFSRFHLKISLVELTVSKRNLKLDVYVMFVLLKYIDTEVVKTILS